MSKDKNVNYTPEQTTYIVSEYEKGTTDAERAEILQKLSHETGKTVPSLRAKLTVEKVYVKKAYVPKTGRKVETKEEIAAAIATAVGVTSEQLQGLEKATKSALNCLRNWAEAAREIAS